jgi:uncharacterized metal-binding protein YceD (DUF177 family)
MEALAWRLLLSVAPEFSRPVALDGVPAGGLSLVVEASAEERRRLARRFDLVDLALLEGEVRLERAGGGGALIHLAGRLRARLAQRCVVTLDPVEAEIDCEFERLFDRSLPSETEDEVEVDAEAELPEPVPPEGLDLGEILAEELALALDPYPRSPQADARLQELGRQDSGAGGPFAGLSSLRRH